MDTEFEKENEKEENAVDELDNCILCTINKELVQKEEVKVNVSFAGNVKLKIPNINHIAYYSRGRNDVDDWWRNILHIHKEHMTSDFGTSYHITNDYSDLHDVYGINVLVKRSSGSMPATKMANYTWK